MSVVTRFAPSPTGFLHIGGARTALFNYLFARHHGGKYLVRVEDTDKKRSTSEAIDAIAEGLAWLGLEGDMPAIMQSENESRHRQIAEKMLAEDTAYKCFLSDDELSELRQHCRENGTALRSPWRDRTDHPADAPYVVRLRMPDAGTTVIDDIVQGQVSVNNTTLDDLVMLRSDGSPTYMLAVVVDDHDMGVTHILRGDDHLNNAFRQYHIYSAAGWQIPIFGHIPLIHGADGAKLSKRHGALGVEAYREMGILPQALLNYLARLGWSHGDDELFTLEQAISWFDGTSIGKSPARFDMEKLQGVNNHWMRNIDTQDLVQSVLDLGKKTGKTPHQDTATWLANMMPCYTERANTINELLDQTGWLFVSGAPELSEQAAAQLNDEARARLLSFAAFLNKSEAQNTDALNDEMNQWLSDNGLRMKDIGIPLRIVVTGSKSAPSLVDIIFGVGFKEIQNRIEQICL